MTYYQNKWLKDFKIKPDTLKLIPEEIRISLEHTCIRDNILNRTLIASH